MTDWEERYCQPGTWCGTEPVAFLREHLNELPRGCVLDLAMGEGRNALFLAQQGYRVTGVEKSRTAIEKAEQRARELGVQITSIPADLEKWTLPVEQFDLVLCFYYLDRNLFSAMESALRRGGALAMETYTVDQLRFRQGPRNPAHLLEARELYQAFRHLHIAYYRELVTNDRALSSLLAFRV
jgi:SAM-dependent methyltransferase